LSFARDQKQKNKSVLRSRSDRGDFITWEWTLFDDMSYRPKSDITRRCRAFCDQQRDLICRSGLPEVYVEKESMFMDFLMHGYIDHHADTHEFSVEGMSPAEQQAFESLAREYFRSGYGYFQPMAFRSGKIIRDFEEEFGSAPR